MSKKLLYIFLSQYSQVPEIPTARDQELYVLQNNEVSCFLLSLLLCCFVSCIFTKERQRNSKRNSNSKLLISRDTFCGTLPHFSVSNSTRQKLRFLNHLNSASELNSTVSVVLCNIYDYPSSDEFLTCIIQ